MVYIRWGGKSEHDMNTYDETYDTYLEAVGDNTYPIMTTRLLKELKLTDAMRVDMNNLLEKYGIGRE